jgi:hypothetical protein
VSCIAWSWATSASPLTLFWSSSSARLAGSRLAWTLATSASRRSARSSIQGPDPLHPVHLPRVVADQVAELADGLRQLPPGGLVRGQVAALPGQHVPGHPGLDLDAHMGDLVLDLDRVQHRVLGAPVLGQGDPEQHRGQQQRQQRDRHHHQPFGSQRQISPGPARSLLVGCPTSIAHLTEMSEDNTPT